MRATVYPVGGRPLTVRPTRTATRGVATVHVQTPGDGGVILTLTEGDLLGMLDDVRRVGEVITPDDDDADADDAADEPGDADATPLAPTHDLGDPGA